MHEFESAEEAMRFIIGIEEDRAIEFLTETLKATPPPTDFPMPDSAHPALTHVADFVRSADLNTFAIPGTHRPAYIDAGDDTYPTSHIHTALLHRRKCVGLAPYVGQRAIYVWDAWIDDLGRAICGPAQRVQL